MGITVYSVAISIVFYNLALIAVFILRRSPGFRAKHAVSLLAFITVLGVVRLVLPIDFDAAYVVRSYKIIPAVEDFLRRPLAASFTYGHLLLALWAVGSLVMVIKDVRLQRRFDRYLQSIDFVDRPELLKIAAEYGNDFAVLISPQLDMPFTSGILHPVIYLPDVELSDAEWRMVFRHEITHIRSRDNLKKLFFLAVEALFWWNPLAHFSGTEINALIELRCDAKVMGKLNDQGQADYIETLKALMGHASQDSRPAVAASLIGTQDEMRLRFEALSLINVKNHHFCWIFLVSLFLIVSYFVILQPARFPESIDLISSQEMQNRMTLFFNTDDIQDGESYILYTGEKYLWFENDIMIGQISQDVLSIPPFNTLRIIQGES